MPTSPQRSPERDPLLSRNEEDPDDRARRQKSLYNRIILAGAAVLTVVVIVVVVLAFVLNKGNTAASNIEILQNDLRTDDIFDHLRALEKIASEHPSGSRSIANAFNASADYVGATVTAAGVPCDIRKQYFDAPVWTQSGPGELSAKYPTASEVDTVTAAGYRKNGSDHDGVIEKVTVHYQEYVDFRSMRYGGQSADVRDAEIVPIFDGGCDLEDYPTFTNRESPSPPQIALIEAKSSSCTYFDAAYMAEIKGYAAVLFYNDAERKRLSTSRVRIVEWQTGDPLMSIPVLSVSHALGSSLRRFTETSDVPVTVNLRTRSDLRIHRTFNLLCEIHGKADISTEQDSVLPHNDYYETKYSDSKVIVVGAHLDSVPAGPGMVDNASGSSTILAMLLAMRKNNLWGKNRLIFAWWGAEEVGLLGSRHYVRQLIKAGRIGSIGAALNFDMLGSPNYTPQIHEGSTAPAPIRKPSTTLQKVFEKSFAADRKNFTYSDMYGGSDFLPFLKAGIPAGGVLTGAGELKTPKERTRFGGIANAALDPCYHQSCDTVENVSREGITLMARAAAYAVGTLLDVDDIPAYLNAGAV